MKKIHFQELVNPGSIYNERRELLRMGFMSFPFIFFLCSLHFTRGMRCEDGRENRLFCFFPQQEKWGGLG